MNSNTYSQFHKVAGQYGQWRPKWSGVQASKALETAGIETVKPGIFAGLSDGQERPVVACLAAGLSSEAACFLELGCDVVLADPSYADEAGRESSLAKTTRSNMQATINSAGVKASFDLVPASSVSPSLGDISADLAVVAQGVHTFKGPHAQAHAEREGVELTGPAEERTRQLIQKIVEDDGRKRLSIWHYNPDPDLLVVRELHATLAEHSDVYAKSNSPLLNAPYFRGLNHAPYLDLRQADASRSPVDVVSLRKEDVKPWLASYSFGIAAQQGDPDKYAATLSALESWHDANERDGVVDLPYVAQITQGAVRDGMYSSNPEHYEKAHQVSGKYNRINLLSPSV